MMNETYEREIDLKWLLCRILRAWRCVVVWAIVMAVVFGAGSFGKNYMSLRKPEYVQNAKTAFEKEHAEWVASGENLKKQIAVLEETKNKQEEYNTNSVLMQIDPFHDFHASVELYVDYEYQILPDMVYQTVDLSKRILKAYSTYMSNGELYQYIIDNVSYQTDQRYLREIISVSVDNTSNMLTVSVRQQSAERCEEILRLVQMALHAKSTDIKAAIADHTLSTINMVVYETVDLSLKEKQQSNKQALSQSENSLKALQASYETWSATPEPVLKVEGIGMVHVKQAVKMAVLGGVLGAVLAALVLAVITLASDKLLNPAELEKRFGIRVIGLLPKKRVKKPFAFVSRWVEKFAGTTATPEDYSELAKVAGTNIKFLLNAEGASCKEVAFAGMLDGEELSATVKAMKPEDGLSVSYVTKMLTSAEAIENVMTADFVVLVEKQEQSRLQDIAREIEALKAWGKPVLGIVIINTDAVM